MSSNLSLQSDLGLGSPIDNIRQWNDVEYSYGLNIHENTDLELF